MLHSLKHPQERKWQHGLPKIPSWGRGGCSWMWRSRSPCWRVGSRWWDWRRETKDRRAAVFILPQPAELLLPPPLPTLLARVTSSLTSPGCGGCDHMVTCFGEESDAAEQVQQSPQLESHSTSRSSEPPPPQWKSLVRKVKLFLMRNSGSTSSIHNKAPLVLLFMTPLVP